MTHEHACCKCKIHDKGSGRKTSKSLERKRIHKLPLPQHLALQLGELGCVAHRVPISFVNPLPLTGCAANYSVRLTSPKNPKTPVFAAVNVVLDAGLGTWAVNTGCAVSLPVVSVPTDGGLATFGVMTSASLVVSAVNLGQDIFPSDTTSSLSLGANGACNGGLDCVSGSCSANRCSCVESGGTCQNASDCCVGNCSTGTCP